MSLGDPFNRISRQHESEYQTLRQTLQTSQVDTRIKAEALLQDMKKKALIFSATIMGIALVLSLIFPQFAIISLVFGCLISLWLITSNLKGQRYIKRYIQQEFSAD